MALKIDDATIKAFMELFRGRKDVWGSVEGKCNKEPVTKKHYERHLQGETSLGVYMLQDDNTCNFAAIDLDEQDTHKALAIRQAFRNAGLPAYLAVSKSKGFHIYLFAGKEPFQAKDIRRVCNGILAKLGLEVELFPKQVSLDEQTPYGNYINLPCFGHTRPFIKGDLTNMALADAMLQAKRIPKDKVAEFIKALPAPPKPKILKTRGRPTKHSKNPPCIDDLMKGVGTGARDVAAFALARYYLDQRYVEEEVLGLLQVWDANNRPPINDVHLLQTKVRSAGKGYQFGCGSIKDDPLLTSFCPGDCNWLRELNADKKKKGLLAEYSFYETATHMYEEIIQEGKPVFASYEKGTGQVSVLNAIDFPDLSIIPVSGAEITESVIQLPTGWAAYGSTMELKNEVKELIRTYVDLADMDMEYCSWYVMLSWVYDRMNTIPYLRFLGDTGCGKSRALDVIGRMCYKSLMMAGAVTPAPIYREIMRFRGSLILEEADFKDTTEKGEVITILNCGIERGRAVIRCSSENPNILEVLPCFGPKIFATRYTFLDKALEARCITCNMEETDREDVPALLGSKFFARARELRKKLLLWRFHYRNAIDPDAVEDIDLGPVEPRLKQMGLPFALPFKDMPDVMEEFRGFMKKRQAEIIHERSESDDGLIVASIFHMAKEEGRDWVSSSKIADSLSTERNPVKPQKVGRVFRSLNLATKKSRNPDGKQLHFLVWDRTRMRKLLKRYFPVEDREEYQYLIEDIDMEI